MATKIQVIIGSTRPGRMSDRLAKWVAGAVQTSGRAEVEIVDLRDYDLPLFNEDNSPRYNPARKPEGAVAAWLDKLAEADAYIIVTPEYNRAVPGVLKNALDFVDFQLEKKPVALAAHGSVGGAFSVAQLRSTLAQLGAPAVPAAVMFAHRVGQVVDEQGNLNESLRASAYGPQASLDAMVGELAWYADALRAAR